MNHRRRRRVVVHVGLLRLDHLLPNQFAVERITKQSQVPKQHEQSLTIGRCRFRRIRTLRVTRHDRPTGVGLVFPKLVTGLQIETGNHPVVNALGRIPHIFAQVHPST